MAQRTRQHSDLSVAVAATLRAERAAAGLTREQVSGASGIPASTYRRIELAERVSTIAQLSQLAPVFGLRVSQLIARAEQRAGATQATAPAPAGPNPLLPDSARAADVEVALGLGIFGKEVEVNDAPPAP